MAFANLAAGYGKTNPKIFILVAVSASLLCAFYLARLTHLGITTPGTFADSNLPILVESRPETIVDRTKDVYNRTLGFEKIFVISLPERSDRRDSIILSAALSNIDIEIVDAVRGENVPDKVIPNDEVGRFMKAEIGCWRSHINLMQTIIQQNLSSILILEDDADWDVRLKDQLYNFALATQAISQASLPSTNGDLLHSRDEVARKDYEIPFDNLPQTVPAQHSPYGDNWDHLWLGHCGIALAKGEGNTPKNFVVRRNDPTVPAKKFLTNNLVGNDLGNYPDHTRLIHHGSTGLCTQSYAITQAGARELMMSVGVNKMTTIDFGLREWCDGTSGRDAHRCLATQPALFQPHRKAGSQTSDSDIDTAAHGNGIRAKAMTEVVRWSTILNWKVLLKGGTNFGDQFPDGK